MQNEITVTVQTAQSENTGNKKEIDLEENSKIKEILEKRQEIKSWILKDKSIIGDGKNEII